MANEYEDKIEFLQANHFYPKLKKEVGKKSTKAIGLVVECAAIILMDSRVERLRQLLPGFSVVGFPNSGEIEITKI